MRPPTHHVVQGTPRDVSSTRSYGVCHTRPRSRSTARQKPSTSSTDQRYSDAKSRWPCCSAKRRSRLRARYRSVGRQAMSIPLSGAAAEHDSLRCELGLLYSVYSALSAYWSALVTPVLHRVTLRKYSR